MNYRAVMKEMIIMTKIVLGFYLLLAFVMWLISMNIKNENCSCSHIELVPSQSMEQGPVKYQPHILNHRRISGGV